MSGCSLVAAGLPSLIGTATPTFSYDNNRHPLLAGDNFGIQMTYMSGTSTCYSGTRPTFTPVISNPGLLYTRTCNYVTSGAPATYTGIFCPLADLWLWINTGAYTINNYQLLNPFAVVPQPFTATFGNAPAPTTIATNTVVVTSTVTNTAFAPVQPVATTTVTTASATTTRTSTATVAIPVTSPFTQIVTSCPTPSSTSQAPIVLPPVSTSIVVPPVSTSIVVPPVSTSIAIPISTSVAVPVSTSVLAPVLSSVIAPVPSASGLSCPASDGATFSTPQGNFIVECFIDRSNNDIGIAPSNPATYEQCIQACASTSGCQAVAYLPSGPCYLKNGLGAPRSNNNVWGARIASVPVSSSAVATTSSTRSSSSPVATTTVLSTTVVVPSSSSSSAVNPSASASCPGSNGSTVVVNGKMYLVECGSDYTGGEIPGPTSPTWPGSYEKCLADCAPTSGCVAVSYVIGGPCYLKSSINGARSNSNVIGGRLISIVSTSVAPTSSVATSSRITSSSPVTSAAPTPNPSTVTVTTTISNTAYQCACTPTSVFSTSSSAPVPSSTAAVTCPGSNGSIFVTSCGASYAVECSADRYGNDLPNGLVYTDTYEQCLQACDKTAGCVNVSWVTGKPGACYMKGSIGAIRDNVNIIGGRKLSGCVPLKLHRKRVAVPAREQKLAKRAGYYGPDFTFVQERVVATVTATVQSTVTTTSSQTFGTATQTAFTLASAIVTTTTSVPTTVYNMITVTTCPLALPIR